MAGRVIWSQLAWEEFDAAADYIGTASQAYAASFVRRVLDAIEQVANWPDSAAIVPEFDDPNLREIFVNRYRIIYQPEVSGIRIVALIHSARDLPKLWDESERREND